MIWKLNHEVGTDQTRAGEPPAASAFARPAPRRVRWPLAVLTGDTHTVATCGWSMSLTRFGVARLRAAAKAMLKQYDRAVSQVATWCRITRLVRSCAENKLRLFS